MKIVVSYAREDLNIVQQIVDAINRENLLVWWDRDIDYGERFQQRIEQEIKACRCLLVVWSSHSVGSNWVQGEVHTANGLGKPVIHVCIDKVEPPMQHRHIQHQRLEVTGGQVKTCDLVNLTEDCKKAIGVKGPKEMPLDPRIAGSNFDGPAVGTPVPGMDIYVSFRPCGENGVFLLMHSDSTDGWVRGDTPTAKERHDLLTKKGDAGPHDYMDGDRQYLKVNNDVMFIMDPLRPYGIQIGGLRSARPNALPGSIRGDFTPANLTWLPFGEPNEWLYLTLAEILTGKETLQYLYDEVPRRGFNPSMTQRIQELISKNPYAPLSLQQSNCLFCADTFKRHRILSSKEQEEKYGAFIVANDFPFGPSFHYLAITTDPIHSWENLTYKHVRGLNLMLWEFLRDEKNTHGAAGISFGLNSTVRHLVLGSKTRSSAGASIHHVHKQAWGMPSNGANIAERLIEVSQAYWKHKVDYQEAYYKALDEAGYVVWHDERVALYVPYGQSSRSELQAMVLQPRGNVTELSQDEIVSLSKAEYIVSRIFKKLEINSFNQVVLSKLLGDTRAPRFRLVETFITRDIDLAVSELSMLFVVDQHPWDSRKEIIDAWEKIRLDVEKELEQPWPS